MIIICVFHYSPFLSLLISSRCFSLRARLIKRRPTPRKRAQHEVVRGSGGWLERCALGCVSYPLNHRHQPTCESRSLRHDGVSSCALKGTLDGGYANTWERVTKAQSASLLSVTHGSPTFPKGPFGASGRTKGRYDRSASPRGVPSALIGQQQASLFWFLRLNNASHPRPLRGVTLSNRSRLITRLFFQACTKQQLFYKN